MFDLTGRLGAFTEVERSTSPAGCRHSHEGLWSEGPWLWVAEHLLQKLRHLFSLFYHWKGITMHATSNISATDSDSVLVNSAIAGDRQAFSHIVERYQASVSSIAYCATGDLGLSEDVAQETFLAAWQQLGQLRDPAKLRSWLFGITRNLTRSSVRQSKRDAVAHSEPLESVLHSTAPQPAPGEQAITREEERLLWNSIEQIPEVYREPLILFYREQQSVSSVAETLDLSPDVVKQRLSRGRKMLAQQMEAFVETALRRSIPGKSFTLAVLAALPALTVSTTAATIGASAAKGSALAKSAATAGLLGALLGPALGFLGGWLGARASIRHTESPREREFMKRFSVQVFALVLVFCAVLSLLIPNAQRFSRGFPAAYPLVLAGVIIGYVLVMVCFSFWAQRRQREIRLEERAASGKGAVDTATSLGWKIKPFEFRSGAELLGWPLVHINCGGTPETGRRIAKGWIAFGDVAIGIVLAAGGIAVGGFAVGGLAAGGVILGGAAFGGAALGGWAMGLVAAGGGAMGWWAAFGGLAIAHDYAAGGLAIASHANDPAARLLLQSNSFLVISSFVMQHGAWFLLLALAPLFLLFKSEKR